MNEATTPRVMVVDDEEMVVTSLESFLTLETSYEVLAYTSPERALDKLDEVSVHVVVADFMMPVMDGIAFLKRVREKNPEATRLLLTGYADKENAIRAINEAGLYYYLEKPWDNEHLKVDPQRDRALHALQRADRPGGSPGGLPRGAPRDAAEADQGLSVTEARRESPYDPLRSRLLLAGGLVGAGLGLQLLAGAPVRAVPFYGLVGTWLVVAGGIFRWG
ncbi:MAG: response regulator, partial [Gemmatimonadetes bacterium]|nr:response regulator [Gemmatimonadota bacterium]NIR78037.1 response regulator [Gemmatimonadota bacterium]NIT86598.1 response regulator [Gemmatimonadota bacterium]NIU30443.1 response regulator [Gemmatimonadota bacterium]NIU35307.1 response regulator [Gemmatimonadota bacterium]